MRSGLRFRLWISLQVRSKEKIPLLGWISGTIVDRATNAAAAVVELVRSAEPMQKVTPSLVIWTEQSTTSAPSSAAFR